jgi:hypothetical protein
VGYGGLIPPVGGSAGKKAPDEGLRVASPDGGLGTNPPHEKFPCVYG